MAKSWPLNHSHAYMVLAVMGTWRQRRMIAIPMGSWVVVASWSGVALLGLQKSVKSVTFCWGVFPRVSWRTPPQETLGNVAHVSFRKRDKKLMKGGLKVYHDHFSYIFIYGLRIYLRRHGTKNMSFSGSLNISQATKLKVFGSLPFPAPEPFTVRVTSPMCEVFFITSALINAMVMWNDYECLEIGLLKTHWRDMFEVFGMIVTYDK